LPNLWWHGEVITKSVEPFQAIQVRITEKGTGRIKVGKFYTLFSMMPQDITVQHKGEKTAKLAPKWGA